MHGGAAPQVKRAARERLDALVDPALTELAKLIETADSDSVKLSAIKDVLDRAGYKATDKHEHSGAVRVEVVYSDDVPGFAAAAARGADDGPR